MIEIKEKHDCCGCSACVQRCPKHCISLKEDEEGFLYPSVDVSECIDCGLCEMVCPWLSRPDRILPAGVLAVKNRNEGERMSSSSGGVFIAVARKVIENGISKINIATEYMDTFLKSVRRQLDLLGGKFKPIDLFMDPVVDDCAAHVARLMRFFAGK